MCYSVRKSILKWNIKRAGIPQLVKIDPWDSVAPIMPIMLPEEIEIMKGNKYNPGSCIGAVKRA